MNVKKACALGFVTCLASLALLTPGWAGTKHKKDADASGTLSTDADNEDVRSPASGADAITGTYVGAFGPHRITVCLQNVVGQTVNGYSVVAGNQRAFSGSLLSSPAYFEVRASEPGDHPEDGKFVFSGTYGVANPHLTGTWTPNDRKLAKRTFDLVRRDFKYNPKQGKYPQASTRLLKTADLENLRPEDLRIMRNEIYARHGYTFRMKDMRDHFDGEDWYMPINFNVSTQLTKIEEKNAELIKKYESYGDNYYDAFGR